MMSPFPLSFVPLDVNEMKLSKGRTIDVQLKGGDEGQLVEEAVSVS